MAARRLKTPVNLILDWDKTLAIRDTMSDLEDIRQVAAARVPPCTSTWKEFEDAYLDDYVTHKTEHFPSRPTDSKTYRTWLASLKSVEMNSRHRVADSHFLKGIRIVDVQSTAEQNITSGSLRLSRGWIELFNMFLPEEDSNGVWKNPVDSVLSILTVNWCTTYIRHCLLVAARDAPLPDENRRNLLLRYINNMVIRGNDVHALTAPQGGSGRIEGDLATSADKLRTMPRPRRELELSLAEPCEPRPHVVVYVGDSATDYECLCAADVGIWLYAGDAIKVNEHFHKTFEPLDIDPPTRLEHLEVGRGRHLFAWTSNMLHVADFLGGRMDSSC